MGRPNQRWQHESSVRGEWVEGMLDERLIGVKPDQISDVL
jgi:hypothetical protein